MAWRLAGRGFAIMAADAGSGDFAVIKADSLERGNHVAVGAHIACANMVCRHSSCADIIVAKTALARRTSENASSVTAFTVNPFVSTGERKAGLDMVESLAICI